MCFIVRIPALAALDKIIDVAYLGKLGLRLSRSNAPHPISTNRPDLGITIMVRNGRYGRAGRDATRRQERRRCDSEQSHEGLICPPQFSQPDLHP